MSTIWSSSQVLSRDHPSCVVTRPDITPATCFELLTRRESWQRSGISAGTWTWRDTSAEWPRLIVSDRALVHDPESLGLTLRSGDDDPELVLWCGGWADVEATIGGQVLLDAPEFGDDASCVAVVDELVAMLLSGGPKG